MLLQSKQVKVQGREYDNHVLCASSTTHSTATCLTAAFGTTSNAASTSTIATTALNPAPITALALPAVAVTSTGTASDALDATANDAGLLDWLPRSLRHHFRWRRRQLRQRRRPDMGCRQAGRIGRAGEGDCVSWQHRCHHRDHVPRCRRGRAGDLGSGHARLPGRGRDLIGARYGRGGDSRVRQSDSGASGSAASVAAAPLALPTGAVATAAVAASALAATTLTAATVASTALATASVSTAALAATAEPSPTVATPAIAAASI